MLLCRAAGVGGKVDQKCAAGQFRQDNTTFCARPASYGGGGHVRNLCWTSSYGQSPGGSRPKLWVGPGTDPWLSLWGVERGRGLSQGGLGSKNQGWHDASCAKAGRVPSWRSKLGLVWKIYEIRDRGQPVFQPVGWNHLWLYKIDLLINFQISLRPGWL